MEMMRKAETNHHPEYIKDGQMQQVVKRWLCRAGLTHGFGRTLDSLPKTCSDAYEPRHIDGNGTKTGGPTFGRSGLPNSELSNWNDGPGRKGGYGGNGGAASGVSLPNFKHPHDDDPPRQDGHCGGNGGSGSGRSLPNILNNFLHLFPNSNLSSWNDEPGRKGGYGGNGGATSGMSLPNFKHLNNDDPSRKGGHNGGNGGSGSGRSLPNILNTVLRLHTESMG